MNRKRWRSLLALIVVFECSRRPVMPATTEGACAGGREVQGATYIGVVFPPACGSQIGALSLAGDKVIGYWLPTPAMIAKAEQALRPTLEASRTDLSKIGPPAPTKELAAYGAREVSGILERLGKYRRQYLGVQLSGGRQRILINFFPAANGTGPDPFKYWKQEWVVVMDGGNWYWRIQYDVATGVFSGFDSNGYA